MDSKNIKKTFFKYVSLNVLGMIGISCYILADTFFVARGRGFIVIIPLTFILSALLGMTGVWIAMPFTELIVTLFSVSMYIDRRKLSLAVDN